MSKDPQEEYLDFEVAHEGWDKYELEDKTIIRVRVVLATIIKIGSGHYAVGTENMLGVQRIPKELKGTPSTEKPTAESVNAAIESHSSHYSLYLGGMSTA